MPQWSWAIDTSDNPNWAVAWALSMRWAKSVSFGPDGFHVLVLDGQFGNKLRVL